MNRQFRIYQKIKYSDIFKDSPQSLEKYLNGMGRTETLYGLTLFISISNNSADSYESFLRFLFSDQSNLELLNSTLRKLNRIVEINKRDVIKKYGNYTDRDRLNLVIINNEAILQIFEYCFDRTPEIKTLTNKEIEVNIFKAILLINEKSFIQEEKAITSTEKLPEKIKTSGLILTQMLPYWDITNFDITEQIITQFIKSNYLFEFLSGNRKTEILLEKFLNEFNYTTWQAFLKDLVKIIYRMISCEPFKISDIKIGLDTRLWDLELLERLVLKDLELITNDDFKVLRNKPFYRDFDGSYRFIFSLFVVELLHKGLFFKFAEINKSLPDRLINYNGFRSFYCDEFSEKFISYRVLSKLFGDRYIKLDGSQMKSILEGENLDGEPDYYVRNGNKVFLFESKDFLINSKIKFSYDFVEYEQIYKRSLYKKLKNNKHSNGAILQLKSNIERLILKKMPFDLNYKSKSLCIYPIIIIHNQFGNVPGLNNLVNYWFQIELEELRKRGLYIDKIRPVTLIDIDSLILYQDLFSNKIVKLEEVIDSYLRQQKVDSVDPFSVFLTKFLYKKRLNSYTNHFEKKLKEIFFYNP
jgi:hypothetical protein